jgi:hypothetical protein
MCSHERGMSIYMMENPNEWEGLKSTNPMERADVEELTYTFGWKIAAHVTIRELVMPTPSESWDPNHLLELSTFLTGDDDAAEAISTYTRHTWHNRIYTRLKKDKQLRVDVCEIFAAEVHVRPCIFPNEWELLSAAKSLAGTLDNVDECLSILAPYNRTRAPHVHPYDEEAQNPPQSLH